MGHPDHDATPGAGITAEQVCVVYDNETGQVAHIHKCLTLEGAPVRSREEVEVRAMELARQHAAKLPWVRVDRLEVRYVPAEAFPDAAVTKVDLTTGRIVTADAEAELS